MSSMGESAAAMNRLCDVAADKFYRSPVGRFNAATIRRDVLSLRTKGLIRMKTREEIDADCAQIESKLNTRPVDTKAQFKGRGGHTDSYRRKMVAEVERVMAETGLSMTQACYEVGTWPRSYRNWKAKLAKGAKA